MGSALPEGEALSEGLKGAGTVVGFGTAVGNPALPPGLGPPGRPWASATEALPNTSSTTHEGTWLVRRRRDGTKCFIAQFPAMCRLIGATPSGLGLITGSEEACVPVAVAVAVGAIATPVTGAEVGVLSVEARSRPPSAMANQ